MREREGSPPAAADRDDPRTGEPEPVDAPDAPDAPSPSKPDGAPETDREPAPGIEHEPEPDGENIVPARHRPGTL
jgi:hypothetical protein